MSSSTAPWLLPALHIDEDIVAGLRLAPYNGLLQPRRHVSDARADAWAGQA